MLSNSSLGWNHLRIDIAEDVDVSDNHKAYAAGVLEGYLTRERIRDFFLNTHGMLAGQKGLGTVTTIRELFVKSISRVKEIGVWDEDSPLNTIAVKDPVHQLVRLATFQVNFRSGQEA